MKGIRIRLRSRVALAAVLVLLAGCGPGGPKMYPVKGKVVLAKPETLKRLVGTSVELQSTTEANTRAYGEIQPDGTFTLSTYREGKSRQGAMEGTHKARILIDLGDSDDEGASKRCSPIPLKYTRFETSGWQIQVPTDSEVVLKVE
jgi:hypothetical protein